VRRGSDDAALDELRDRSRWLIRLRWVAIAGVFVTIWVADRLLGVRLAVGPLLITVAALAGYNLLFWATGRWVAAATAGVAVSYFANLQFALDLTALTALIHFAGGIENPFLCYYVFHIVIASILVSRAATYLQVTLAMVLLVGMAVLEAAGVLRHYRLIGFIPVEMHENPVYIFGILFSIGTMLCLTAFMATSITGRLRRREAEIVRLSDALREHAADLGRAYEALRQLADVRSDYLNRVAHHIRSPLATLERMLAVVVEGRTGELHERTREMLDRSRVRVGELLALARDLLVLSRTREAPPLGERERVDLVSLVRETANEFRPQAAEAGISLQTEFQEEAAEITGDPGSLQELVENLVSNAVKYTGEGGEVRIGVRPRGRRVELTVSDTGIGIPREEREQVFDEFYRATNARETGKEGTGLGLSIVKAIADAVGGELSVESEVGKGSCFRVLLPRETRLRALSPVGQ
jgi:signal transduction histidine kinase